MTKPDFTPRNVSKYVVKTVVYFKTAELAEDVIIRRTRFEEDSLAATLASNTIGWYVSDRLKPYTDKMVDTTADFVVTQRVKYQDKKAKKNAK